MENEINTLVSIIMPSYNHGKYIKESIDSVINQTYTNWELIIVDNNSIDNTDTIISSFNDSRITVFKISNEGIIAKSRNMGLRNAHGEYVAFLDSDDIWNENKLERQLKIFDKYSDVAIVGSKCKTFPKIINNLNINKDLFVTFDLLLKYNVFINSSVIIRNSNDRSILLDESERIIGYEDYDLWLKILNKKAYGYIINEDLIYYRVHDSQISSSDDIFSRLTKTPLVIRKYESNNNYLKAMNYVFRDFNAFYFSKNNSIRHYLFILIFRFITKYLI